MQLFTQILIGFIAIAHLYFLYFEMFQWETIGKKIFRAPTKDYFSMTKSMMANQGIYNGFLAAGLTWSLFIQNSYWAEQVSIFFLSCVVIAGIVGALTVSKRIFYFQGIPALLALLLLIVQ